MMRNILTLLLSVYEAGRAVSASYTDIMNKGEEEHMCLNHPSWRLACHFPHSWSQITLVTRGVRPRPTAAPTSYLEQPCRRICKKTHQGGAGGRSLEALNMTKDRSTKSSISSVDFKDCSHPGRWRDPLLSFLLSLTCSFSLSTPLKDSGTPLSPKIHLGSNSFLEKGSLGIYPL